MSYQVISRKYRPQRFDEIIGQSHICSTLRNAIKTSRISHAYLFTGSRGIGKTSTARILAKSLNCTNPHEYNPCNECQNCKEITTGRSLDVLEIDGASNRGIDQIRDLRENVKYPPASSNYRIFIIDEVHMLTKEAFNALLKTLEEPPPHVIFIFATTEPLKIPATIISRCQRYDFHRISVAQIVRQLSEIDQKEGVDISDDILMLIAKKAEGSMRDAESLLDQLIASSDKSVTMEDARKILSLIDYEFYIDIGNEIYQNNAKSLLLLAGKIIDEGINVAEFLNGFSEHFRNLLIANTTNSVDMLDLPDNIKNRYLEEADKWISGDILRLIKIVTDAQVGLKTSLNQRMHIEFTLLRMGAMHNTVAVEDILDSIKNKGYTLRNNKAESVVKETLDLFQPDKATGMKPVKPEPKPVSDKKTEIRPIEEPAEAINQDLDNNITLGDIIAKWDTIIGKISDDNPSLSSFLREGKPHKLKGNVLEVIFENDAVFHLNTIKSRSAVVEKIIEEVLDKPIKIKCIKDKTDPNKSQKTSKFDKMTKKVMDAFSGEIIPT
ncbi:MAG: DNA polymerase III subunit gamma/tau [Candidatus Marinimicrobia bacterium]|nr:DNA polymerase III subunit gamma/tau [Candidatus Neomarinimicrobiota bacterium]